MHIKALLFVLLLSILLAHVPPCHAFIVINEILADPPSVDLTGDANGDGVYSATQDEFVEIFNIGPALMDISGWSIHDAVKERHIFPPGTFLSDHGYLVVFGGGNPSLEEVFTQVATSGSLGLNNTKDAVYLYNNGGQLIDQFKYGKEGGKDQSLVRMPEGTGSEFVLHSSIAEADGDLFSPGRPTDGSVSTEQSTVPELSSLVYLYMGMVMMFLNGRVKLWLIN